MNKNLLLGTIILVVVVLTYIGVFFLGRNSIKSPEGKIEIRETVKLDTVTAIRKIYVNRYIETESKGDSIKSYSDSIVGDTLDTKYNIQHTISDSQKTIRSWWKVNIEPHLTTIIKTITKDSIQTKINNIYIPKPFLMNSWFYVSLISWVIAILAIVF